MVTRPGHQRVVEKEILEFSTAIAFGLRNRQTKELSTFLVIVESMVAW